MNCPRELLILWVTFVTYLGYVESQSCVCVNYNDCNSNLTLKQGVKELHENLTLGRERPSCKNPVDVCCGLDDSGLDSSVVEIQGCESYELRKDNFSTNADAAYGEFPWVVPVLRAHSNNSVTYLGAGSLINGNTVLTTAATTQGLAVNQILARIGAYNLFHPLDLAIDFKVSSIHVHPKYNPKSHDFDFALLKLERPVALGRITPICLAQNEVDYDFDQCIEIGWGKNSSEIDSKGGLLKKSRMHVVDLKTCEIMVAPADRATSFRLPESVLCAGDNHDLSALCTGDSGSPLICSLKSNSSQFVQVGLASIARCGERMKPGVFADVAQVTDWINQSDNFNGKEALVSELYNIDN